MLSNVSHKANFCFIFHFICVVVAIVAPSSQICFIGFGKSAKYIPISLHIHQRNQRHLIKNAYRSCNVFVDGLPITDGYWDSPDIGDSVL